MPLIDCSYEGGVCIKGGYNWLWKIGTPAAPLYSVDKFRLFLEWVAIAALMGLSLRSFFGYRRARQARDSQRTRHLYDKNLANNAAVLHVLINQIAREELKEALLAYAFVAAADGAIGCEADLDRRTEDWLRERFGVEVNFDCPDAVETLDRLDLWTDRGAWRVASAQEAIDRLEAHWRDRRTIDYHRQAVDRA